jgi:tetratricopeptide (TPR) repeat protein
MAQQTELRVFISSTFHDLQEEREYLIKKVFPEIRQLCRARGVEFTEIDLRWGLTEEEATHGKIIRTCLEEIDRCRPYFIGIIGERYGWSPKFHEVQKDAELIRKYPWIEEMSADNASIIDMEFEYGVLREPSHAYGAYFYFRKNPGPAATDSDTKKLEALKKRTKASKRPVKEFSTTAELGEKVRDDLKKLVELHWHLDTTPSPLETEWAMQEAFASTRRRAYILNPKYLTSFNEFIEKEASGAPLVISGPSGIGKSSLMAYLAHSYRRRNPDAFLISHYIGASVSTADHSGILRHICLEIKERLHLEEEPPTTVEELTKEFPNWLAKVQDEKIILFIDALNQLEGNSVGLGWLPAYLPPNVRLICSATEGPSLDALRERKAEEIEVTPLDAEEREAIIVRFLGEYHKGLSPSQTKLIAQDPKSSTPLYLRTMLEELRLVGNFDQIDKHINHYLGAEDLDDLFQRVLERMEEDYGAALVEKFMTLLWCSRKGLAESELLDLFTDISATPDDQPLTRLDLSLLLNALDYHLIRKDGLLSFFHNYLRNAVEKRYLIEKEKELGLHKKLGAYFATLPIGKRRTDEEPWQWEKAEAWDDFNKCLTDIPVLETLLEEERLYELIGYWLKLREHFDAPTEYRIAIERFERECVDRSLLPTLYNKLGNAFYVAGSYEPAEHFYERALVIAKSLYSDSDIQVGECMNNLGNILRSRGKFDEAETILNNALFIYQTNLGHENIKIVDILDSIANLHYSQGKFESAEKLFKQALSICQALLGGEHKQTISLISNLAAVYIMRNDLDAAENYATKALRLNEKFLGKEHPGTASEISNLAAILIEKGQFENAIPLVERTIDINKKVYGQNHPEVASNFNNLGYLYSQYGNVGLSIKYYLDALNISKRTLGIHHPDTAKFMYNLAQVYFQNKEYQKSAELHLQSFEIRKECLGLEDSETQKSISRILSCFTAKEDPRRAYEFIEKLLNVNYLGYFRHNEELLKDLLMLGKLAESQQLNKESEGFQNTFQLITSSDR